MDFTKEQLDRKFTACYIDGSIAWNDYRVPRHFTLREAMEGVTYRTHSGAKGFFKLSQSNLKKLARLQDEDLQCLYGSGRFWVGARLSDGAKENEKEALLNELDALQKQLSEIVKPLHEAIAEKKLALKALNKSTKGKVKK